MFQGTKLMIDIRGSFRGGAGDVSVVDRGVQRTPLKNEYHVRLKTPVKAKAPLFGEPRRRPC